MIRKDDDAENDRDRIINKIFPDKRFSTKRYDSCNRLLRHIKNTHRYKPRKIDDDNVNSPSNVKVKKDTYITLKYLKRWLEVKDLGNAVYLLTIFYLNNYDCRRHFGLIFSDEHLNICYISRKAQTTSQRSYNVKINNFNLTLLGLINGVDDSLDEKITYLILTCVNLNYLTSVETYDLYKDDLKGAFEEISKNGPNMINDIENAISKNIYINVEKKFDLMVDIQYTLTMNAMIAAMNNHSISGRNVFQMAADELINEKYRSSDPHNLNKFMLPKMKMLISSDLLDLPDELKQFIISSNSKRKSKPSIDT